MSNRLSWLAIGLLAGCGGGGGDDVDAPVPVTVRVSGTATEQAASGGGPLADVLVEAFAASDENTVVASAMTDANGMYTLTVTATGALDGYLRATKSGLLVTYLYPAEPLAADFDGASINMLTQGTLDALSGLLCRANQASGNGLVAVLVNDASDNPVAGATISSSPAASDTCYNGSNGLPNGNATATSDDGIGYLFNVTGDVTVMASGSMSHGVKARAGALTTTLVHP
jgi:hypothetical protein